LPTFAAFVDGKMINQTQTNKFEVLKDLVNEVI
jgi:thioredoxin 1